jgi:hypothetical protein
MLSYLARGRKGAKAMESGSTVGGEAEGSDQGLRMGRNSVAKMKIEKVIANTDSDSRMV